MTAIQLYKFIHDNNIEFKWTLNNNEWDVLIFPYTFQVSEFNDLLPKSIFDDSGIECTMKDGYFAFWMEDICKYSDIELEEVFGSNPYADKKSKTS